MPIRIQRKRRKGWRMPAGAVYVGRPTIWGNPFYGADDHDIRTVVLPAYREWVLAQIEGRQAKTASLFSLYWKPRGITADLLKELRGRDLCCWCALTSACHADVLLELANRP